MNNLIVPILPATPDALTPAEVRIEPNRGFDIHSRLEGFVRAA